MSQIKTLNGVQYTLPQYNDTGWGANTGNVLTQYLAAIADVTLQLSGGSFTLTADANFGATYGLVSTYFKSRTANIATAGQIRLASADVISWRNNANGANIDLSKDTSDVLKYNATKILLSGAVVNADINASAAIAYSKLNLATSIVNADIASAAAIAYSKLAALTISRALVSDGSGVVSVATTTAAEIGFVNGVTSAIQTQINTKAADSAVVHNTGIESIAGAKTFTSILTMSGANINMGGNKVANATAGTTTNDGLVFGQAFTSGAITFSPTTTGIVGTATNDNAAAGIVGEAVKAGPTNVSVTTAAFLTVASITLTAGDWDISFVCVGNAAASATEIQCGIATATNASTGYSTGDNAIFFPVSATFDGSGSVANYRVSITGSTTYYLTAKSFGATISTTGRISARRIR